MCFGVKNGEQEGGCHLSDTLVGGAVAEKGRALAFGVDGNVPFLDLFGVYMSVYLLLCIRLYKHCFYALWVLYFTINRYETQNWEEEMRSMLIISIAVFWDFYL